MSHPLLKLTDHRPYPVPRGSWLMRQTWRDLLFAHWPMDAELLRPLVPEPLQLDLYDDKAWVAVVPFHMTDVGVRRILPLPFASRFAELNVRTYVRLPGDERRGVYFFSLDAASRAAVAGARAFFRLPYFNARMVVVRKGDRIEYESVRRHRGAPPARLRMSYEPSGEPTNSQPGSVEEFLTERYCLYTVDRGGRTWRADIHHKPWPLQPAQARFAELHMMPPEVPKPKGKPLLWFAERLEVLVWPLRRADVP